MNIKFFHGKKVLVMGLGRFGGGVDTVKFAADAGASVTVTDSASAEQLAESLKQLQGLDNVNCHLGGHDPADFERAEIVIANPAVALDNEFLRLARDSGALVTSQMGIFFQLCHARIIGITGANGKSTTTALTAHLLKNARRQAAGPTYEQVWLSGNIGDQPLLTILHQIRPPDLVVLEISSFQIEQLAEVRKAPSVALLTNLTPNHLDRYGTFDAYCAAKQNLFRLQPVGLEAPAVSIFNAEDEISLSWFEKYRGEAGRLCLKFSADDVSQDIRAVYRLPGRANLSNLAGAMTIARSFGLRDEDIRTCLPDFKALPHRLELIAESRGVRWYNDSKATTPQGTMVALEAFGCPIILIAGGYDKHLPFDELGRAIAAKAKAVVLIGQTASKIAQAVEDCPDNRATIRFADSLASAVDVAHAIAQTGDVVLLSPACASYDMFENYEHRGRQFAELMRAIS